MSDPSKTKFSTNILAIAGLITAVGGLVTILHQTTDIFSKNKEKEEVKTQFVNEFPVQLQNRENTQIQNQIIPENSQSGNSQNNFQQTEQTNTINNQTASKANLTGYWVDKINEGRYYLEHNQSGQFTFQEYSFLEGFWMVTAEGIGSLNGNTIQITYNTLFGMPGTFKGTLNGQSQIIGKARDMATGIEVPIHLIKE